MKNIIKGIQLNVNKVNYSPIATLKQEDNAAIELILYKDGEEFNITGQTVTLAAKRPDKVIIEQIDGFNINNNTLTINLKNNIIAKIGLVYLELTFKDATGSMTTLDFYLKVNGKILGEDSLDASDNIASLEKVKQDFINSSEELLNTVTQNEDIRVQAEKTRKNNEETRNRSETSRANYETKRVEAEKTRVNQEGLRVAAEEKRAAAEILRDEKIKGFGSQVTENTKNIAENTKDIERAFETINDGSYLPFEGENITVEHSKVGFTKDMGVDGRTLFKKADGSYTDVFEEGCTLISSCEKEGKISILSRNKNLFDVTNTKQGAYLYNTGVFIDNVDYKYIEISPIEGVISAENIGVGGNDIHISFWKGSNYISGVIFNYGSFFKIAPPENSDKIIFSYNKIITNIQYEKSEIKTEYVPSKANKKEILLPYSYGLKGFPDGAKDTLENREDGIYAIKRVERRIFSGSENENWLEASKTGNTRRFYLMETGKKAGITKNILCDKLPTLFNVGDDRNEKIGVSGYFSDGRIYIKFLDAVVTGTINDYLRSNPVVVYYELETPIEHKILDYPTTNLETFKDITHVFSENSISPSFSFKAPVDVPVTISTLRVRNENLEQENKELKEEVDTKTLKLHGQDVELTNSDLDLDFRIFELEMSVGVPMNLNVKGVKNMARSPFEMMKILILNNNYDREDIEYKASRYLQGKRMTQTEYDEIISLMDANELVK